MLPTDRVIELLAGAAVLTILQLVPLLLMGRLTRSELEAR